MPRSPLSAEISIGYSRIALEHVWEGWVGNQTPAEFLSFAQPGQSIRDQVDDYVASFDYSGLVDALDACAEPGEDETPDPDITRESVRADVADALTAYLELTADEEE